MPVQHASRTCPKCGYGLVTCTGPVGATELTGVCGACGTPMVILVDGGSAGVPIPTAEPVPVAPVEPPVPLPPNPVVLPLVEPRPPAPLLETPHG